ncbi:MAG: FGGY family carbohydrate kinase [Aerococcaceae bacterium]|nr:FGGY family carbohydrate kinase [Aerococcaceae bacterium]
MNLAPYILSIDIGTTHLKFTLCKELKVAYQISKTYTDIQKNAMDYSLNTNEILSLITKGIQEIIAATSLEKLDIVLTSAMHSVQLLTPDLQLDGRLLTWADLHGKQLVDCLDDKQQSQYLRTGTPIHSMNPFYKIKEKVLQGASIGKIGSIKDVVIYHLTKNWVLDESCASSTGLFHTQKRVWDKEILNGLQLTEAQLPQVVAGNTAFVLREDVLKNYQLKAGRLFVGYSDGVSSNGLFKKEQQMAVLSIGTSHAVRMLTAQPLVDSTMMNFCYIVDADRYIVGFPSNNGGNVLEWLREVFRTSFEEIERIVQEKRVPQSIFLPFLNGERSPIWNDYAKASFYKIDRETTRDDLIYSIVLGMMFTIRKNVESLMAMHSFQKIAITGGFSKSSVLSQLLADILQLPLYLPQVENIETLGTLQLLTDGMIEVDYLILVPREAPELHIAYQQFKAQLEKEYGN